MGDEQLEASSVVANSTMNRERGLGGVNSFARELGVNPLEIIATVSTSTSGTSPVAWLDLCCGRGRALRETADLVEERNLEGQVRIVGVDLVDYFEPVPSEQILSLVCASVTGWEPAPDSTFDLITCVHGLHYVGDKLAVLARAASWLKRDGRLYANIDFANLRTPEGLPVARPLSRALRAAGFVCDFRRHRISLEGRRDITLPYRYLGADDRAGPNYTGQDAVNSFYRYRGADRPSTNLNGQVP